VSTEEVKVTPRGTTRTLKSEGGETDERLRVFVAEGSASDLFWLEMVFKSSRLPYTIEVVSEARAAVEYLAQRDDASRPHLIFLDGLELLEQLALPTPDPLFVLTNSASAADLETFRRRFGDPARRIIEKPFTHQKLFDCLAAADLNAWAARR
jgi:CheY-like chemotaxis protein